MKKGQIALIVLVISALVLTIGLSLSKKSVVETRITTDEELLKRAFNAAESGVDYYLGTGQTSFTSSDHSMASVGATGIGGGSSVVNLGGKTLSSHNNYVWLMGHKTDGSLNPAVNMNNISALSVCVENGFSGSLIVTYFYKEGGNYEVGRMFGSAAVLPACAGVSGLPNGMNLSSLLLVGTKQPILLVVEPVGDDTKVAAAANGNFPDQAMEINSVGKAGNLTGTPVNREINVINQYQIPSFMLEAVTASGNVLSN